MSVTPDKSHWIILSTNDDPTLYSGTDHTNI